MYKGISLHIGLNRLNANQYSTAGTLCSPENDANALAELARSENYESVSVLVNENATKANFMRHFSASIKNLYAGDTFLLTFSGHCGQVEDTNFDEVDGKDERWCFYDDYLLDDEIGNQWKEFREGVRIIVVSSSCHSRTCIKPDGGKLNIKKILGDRTEPVKRPVLHAYPNDPTILASIIHLSACEDQQQARDGDQLTVFINLLLKYWDQGQFAGNYEDLIWKVSTKSGYLQNPAISTLGKNCKDLVNSKPFKLLTSKT